MTPPAGPARRRPSRAALAVLIVVAVAAAAAGVLAGVELFGRHSPGGTPTSACHAPVAPSAAEPGAGTDELAVAEQGFTRISQTAVSIGGIITNRSDRAAYHTRVSFRVLDQSGASMVPAGGDLLLYQEIPVIPPRARAAVGASAGIGFDKPGEIARVDIQIGATRWVPADGASPLFRPPTVTNRNVRITGATTQAAHITFNVEPTGCPGLTERGAGVVFRNRAGTIVGGGIDTTRVAERCDGTAGKQAVEIDPAPADADPNRTDLSVYCDTKNPPSIPAESPAPIN